jgi:glycosyltransferase involved in cell wall biosynthesis
MRKLLFIGNMAAPYQVKLCRALQAFYATEFWFHTALEPDRPEWWRLDLGADCKILGHVQFARQRRYLSLDILSELQRFDPDVLILGGFTLPSNAFAYLWAKARKKRVIVFTELRRDAVGKSRPNDRFARVLRAFYAGLDCVLTASEEATLQLRDEYQFKCPVVTAQYPADLEAYFDHPARELTKRCRLLFANRLIDIYDPLLAIEIFAALRKKHPHLELRLNASGPLRDACQKSIAENQLGESARFLDAIKSWDTLPDVYRDCDLLILPARYSAGNFTVLEAMASGMGIVLSDKVQNAERFLGKEEAGALRVPPARDAFVAAVERFLAEPALLERTVQSNRQRARAFTVGATAALFDQLIRKYAT